MLIGLNPLLRGEVLQVLRDLGHGETILIADCNYPSYDTAKRADIPVMQMDCDTTEAGRAILSVYPLDSFVDVAVHRMEIGGASDEMNEAHQAFASMMAETAGPQWKMGSIERFAFYEEATKCAAVFATLERIGYANYILKKGVIGPDGNVV